MASKVLVVPNPLCFAAASNLVLSAGVGSLWANMPLGAAATRSTRHEMHANRRDGLQQMVLSILASAPPGAATVVEGSVQLLEGIGAVVMDASLVDRRHLEGSGQALVFENVYIPLVLPEPTLVGMEVPASPVPWHLQTINAAALRNQGFDGAGILIGVLDTGIDATHQEFAGKNIHFAEFDGDGNQLSTPPRDSSDHGTHVCGLIAGSSVGVAPAADLAVAAVLTGLDPHGNPGGSLVQIAAGLNWLVTHPFRADDRGVDLVNASLGAPGYRPYLYSTLVNHAIPMVAAIGNYGRLGKDFHGSPGNYDVVIGVGATDAQDQIAAFSDWGTVSQHQGLTKPDLVAPGLDVYSSLPGGTYGLMSGTSMASPIVAGACALLLQQNPGLAFGALRRAIITAVRPLPSGRAGAGRLIL